MNDSHRPAPAPQNGSPTAAPAPAAPAGSAAPRFDRGFIEEHHLLERYLDGKLPLKGALDLERWCAEHPEYLEEKNLAGRTHASLKLLEASGRAPDLAEPRAPWWKAPWLAAALGAIALIGLIAAWSLHASNALLRSRLAVARAQVARGSMLPPASQLDLTVDPDRAAGIGRARFTVSHGRPTLVDLHVAMGYVRADRFRVAIDERDQGPVLAVKYLAKDSNGNLNLAFNSSALAAGRYDIRIEALPLLGAPVADGWLVMDVQ